MFVTWLDGSGVKDIIGRDICCDCLECALKNKAVISPGGMIYENEYIIIHPHLFVKLKGFIVISPKRHVSRMSDLTEEEMYSVGQAIAYIKLCLKLNQIADDVNVQYIEEDGKHLEIWVVAKIHPLLEAEINKKHIASDDAMKYYGITPSEPIEILYTVQILKTYFKAKTFTLAAQKE